MVGERGPFGLFSRERIEDKKTPEVRAYNQAARVYRVWHAAEGKKRDITDFDLTSGPSEEEREFTRFIVGDPTREERRQRVTRLSELLEVFEDTTVRDPREKHNLEFGCRQVEASLWFARRLAGHRIDTQEFLQKTTGKSESIPERVLANQQQLVLELARDAGIEDLSERGVSRWRREHSLSVDEASSRLRDKSREAIRTVAGFIENKRREVEFSVKPEDVYKYWWVWADTNKTTGRFVLRQNFSTERGKIWTPGKVEELGPHEGGEHLLRMAMRQDQIRNGELHPFFGLTTVHGPEAIVDEGLATTITKFVPGIYEELSPEGRFQVESSILRHIVYANQQLKPNGSEQTRLLSKTVKAVKEYIPWESRQEIDDEIRERHQNPLLETYRYAYGIGSSLMLAMEANLSDQGKKEFLNNIYSRPYTIEQVEKMYASLLKTPKYSKPSGRQLYRESHPDIMNFSSAN